LTDSRFVNVGVGFGTDGLRQVLSGMPGEEGKAAVVAPSDDHARRIVRKDRGITVTWYLATDAESRRWSRLPALEFATESGPVVSRRPVLPDDRDDARLTALVEVVRTVVERADGTTTIDRIVREARARLGDAKRGHHVASLAVLELRKLGVLELVP